METETLVGVVEAVEQTAQALRTGAGIPGPVPMSYEQCAMDTAIAFSAVALNLERERDATRANRDVVTAGLRRPGGRLRRWLRARLGGADVDWAIGYHAGLAEGLAAGYTNAAAAVTGASAAIWYRSVPVLTPPEDREPS